MKVISPGVHAVLDYLTVIFLFLSPTIFGMTGNLAVFTYALGGVHLLITLLTDFRGRGVIKLIPFKTHGYIELVVAIGLGVLAYWLHTRENVLGHNYYAALAVVILVVFLLTDWKEKIVARYR